MMEKLSQAGEGGGARPPPFTLSTITYKVVVYTPAERTDTLPIFLSTLPYMYSELPTQYSFLPTFKYILLLKDWKKSLFEN
jgi:hypothetical protein